MNLSLCSLSSGSSGNSYLVKTDNGSLIIDAGISASRIIKGIERTETKKEELKALFVTHEHSDHVNGIRVLMKKLPELQLFASRGTLQNLYQKGYLGSYEEIEKDRMHEITTEDTIDVCGMHVRAFPVLHDSKEPFGYNITKEEKSISIVTDTGLITEDILYSVFESDILVLEANHDTEVLRQGSYPQFLKKRILGEEGHLSNMQAAKALCKILNMNNKKRCVLLAHLSDENNNPALAEKTVCTILAQNGYFTGSDLYLGVLLRDRQSYMYNV